MTQHEPLYRPEEPKYREQGLRTLARSDTAALMPAGTDPRVRTTVLTLRQGPPEQHDRKGAVGGWNRVPRTLPKMTLPASAWTDSASAVLLLSSAKDEHRPPPDAAAGMEDVMIGNRMDSGGRGSSFSYHRTRSCRDGTMQSSERSSVSYRLHTGPPLEFDGSGIVTGSSVSIWNE